MSRSYVDNCKNCVGCTNDSAVVSSARGHMPLDNGDLHLGLQHKEFSDTSADY